MTVYDPSRLFGLPLPILQAPMAGVSTPALAAAVTNAGGMGAIAVGAVSVSAARDAILETRARTAGLFNVNLFCHAPPRRDAAAEAAWLARLRPAFEALGASPPTALGEPYCSFRGDDGMLRLLLALRPPVVSFHFGLPDDDQLAALRAAGIRTLATATNLAEAERIERAGIDGIVAQGVEAGGHRGHFDPDAPDPELSTWVLTRLLVDRVRVPVIAAGGIMDGRGITAALALGAAGAQLGTAFVLCPESAADAAYRAAMASPAAYATRLTAAISGRPARGLPNRFDGLGLARPDLRAPDYPIAYDAAKALHAAARARGDDGFAPHWAGQGAPLARELPAERLVAALVREM